MAIACKYLSCNIRTVVGEWRHGYFRLGYFSSPTHFDLVSKMARKVWRHCVLVFAHGRYSHAGRAFFFPLVTSTFSSFNATCSHSILDHRSCFNSPVSGVKSCAIEVSDLYFSSPLSSIVDNWASIFSDESPCRTIPIRFWVARTHVFSICTDFPSHHQMESLT